MRRRSANNKAARVLGAVIIVILGGIMLLESPSVQKKISDRVMAALENSFDAKVSCDGIYLKPFNALVIDNLLILDEKYSPADTFARVGHLSATLSPWGLLYGEGIHVGRLRMKDIDFHLITEAPAGSEHTSNLQRIFRLKKKDSPKEKSKANLFDVRRARADGLRFRMNNLVTDPARYKGRGINYADLDARASFKVHRLSFGGGLLKASIDELKLSEKCGYKDAVIRGRLRVGLGKVQIDRMSLEDGMSDLHMPHFAMILDGADAFGDFVNKVSFDARIENSIVDYATVQSFSYNLPHCRLKAEIKECKVSGPVNDLQVDDLTFTDLRSSTSGTASCHLVGVARKSEDESKNNDGVNFAIDASIRQFRFTGRSITTFLGYFAPSLNLTVLVPGHSYVFNGRCTGFLQKMNVLGNISSAGIGGLGTRMQVRNAASKARPIEIEGGIYTDRFNLGEALGKSILGECTMHSAVRAKLTKGSPSVILDSLSVSKLSLLGYDYSGITAAGHFDGKAFDGRLAIDDPNIKFTHQGKVSVPKKGVKQSYIFDDVLYFANLSALGLDKRQDASFVSLSLSTVYRYGGDGSGDGNVRIGNLRLGTQDGIKDIGDIACSVSSWNGNSNVSVNSSFADIDFTGSGTLPSFISDFKALTVGSHLPALLAPGKPGKEFSGHDYRVTASFHDSRDLMSFAAPGLYISDSSRLAVSLSGRGVLEMELKSPRLAFKDNYIKKAETELDNYNGRLRMTVANEEFKYAGLTFKDSFIDLTAHNDSISTSLKYDSPIGENNFGELYAGAFFSRPDGDTLRTVIHTLPSLIRTMGSNLELHESTVTLGGGHVRIDSLEAKLDGRRIALAGGVSKTRRDSLSLDIDSLDLSIVSKAMESKDSLKGFLSGYGFVNSPLESANRARLDLRIDSLEAGGHRYERIELKGGWDDAEQALKLTLNGTDEDKEHPDLAATWKQNSGLKINADLKRMNIALIQPFIKNGVSGITGCLNGKINADINKGAMAVTSEGANAENLEATLSSTGVHYRLNGPFSINDKVFSLDKMKVEDKYGGSGEVNGSLTFDKERNILLDAGIKTSGIEVLDIEQSFEKNLSGHLNARADVRISGSLDELNVVGNVGTNGQGKIYLATGNATAVKSSDLLSFKRSEGYVDPYYAMISKMSEGKKKSSRINLKLQASINSGTEATIEIDKSRGNGIIANGKGNIGIDLQSRTGQMNLTGEYAIEKGKFHFEIPGIVSKDFSLSSGSSVKLNGDLAGSELDIHGVYNMKTSLSTLIADSTASGRRPVQCMIGIGGKLSNPVISFDVNVPDLDPTTRTQVEAALNTDDKKQKQFIALLVMGSFLPNEQSGVVNSSNILYSNVSEIMSGQLNSILQRLNIPVDLGVGYQQASNGKDLFDVAVSTQLFNNRVVVDGTVANRQYKTSGNTASVVGDINIELKLDKPGNFRLKLFSHSADEHTSFLDYSQRNGVGVSLQKEFDNFPDLWKNIFPSQEKRGRARLEEIERNKQKTKITINE